MTEMDEIYFNDILNSSRHAIVSMDLQLTVKYANNRTEKILGVSTNDLIGIHNPFGIPKDIITTYGFILKSKESVPINVIKLSDGTEKQVSGYLSGHIDSNENLIGVTLFIRDLDRRMPPTSTKRRSFSDIRATILHALKDGRKTINQISKDVDINWKTVENHLTYLAGRQYIHEVFSSEYVRIFGITEKGRIHLERTILPQKESKMSKEDYALSQEVEP